MPPSTGSGTQISLLNVYPKFSSKRKDGTESGERRFQCNKLEEHSSFFLFPKRAEIFKVLWFHFIGRLSRPEGAAAQPLKATLAGVV